MMDNTTSMPTRSKKLFTCDTFFLDRSFDAIYLCKYYSMLHRFDWNVLFPRHLFDEFQFVHVIFM
jgi:hypothetical protein